MPSNYKATQTEDGTIWISGHDSAGWTLDGYVIPRLASGLIFAKEDPTSAAMFNGEPRPDTGQGTRWAAYNPFSDPQSAYNNPDKGPHKGTPDDLFPDGVPLHGDLTPEQQAWLDKRSSKLAVQGDSFDDEEWEPSDLKSKKPHGPVNRPKDEKVSWGSLHVPCDDCGKPVPAVKFASVSKCASCEAAGHSKYYTGPPPKVDPKVPRFAIDRHLGGVHVGTPDHEVEKQIRDAVAHQRKNDTKGDWTPKIEEQSVKYALWRHHENLGGYRAVMGSAHESRSEIACFNCKRSIHYNEGEGWKDNYTGGECSMGGHHIPVPAREASKTAAEMCRCVESTLVPKMDPLWKVRFQVCCLDCYATTLGSGFHLPTADDANEDVDYHRQLGALRRRLDLDPTLTPSLTLMRPMYTALAAPSSVSARSRAVTGSKKMLLTGKAILWA